MKTPIAEMLLAQDKRTLARFHMPGHKGRAAFLPQNVLRYDITELSGTDNLMLPTGVIAASQREAARLMYARSAYYLVGGSTAGVLASFLSMSARRALVARDFHLSAWSAMVLSGIQPHFIVPEDADFLSCVITPQQAAKAMADVPQADVLYITYPNYYGYCCDLKEIVRIAHKAGKIVIVDGAHAAAFPFSQQLPLDCGRAGADLFTVSLHKTLNAPNQCAMLCVGENCPIPDAHIKRAVNLVQTTSPSYLLLASMEYALAQAEQTGMDNALALARKAAHRLQTLPGLSCEAEAVAPKTGAVARDCTKIILNVQDRGLSGFQAAHMLEEKGVFCETADAGHVLLMCSAQNTWEDYAALFDALEQVFGTDYSIARHKSTRYYVRMPLIKTPREMYYTKTKRVEYTYAVDRICAEAVGAYPPGVPMLLPGQRITADFLQHLSNFSAQGYTLFGTDGSHLCVAEEE